MVVIGLFGLGEILVTIEEGLAFEGKRAKINVNVVWQTWKKLPRYWLTLLRSSAVGCWMGITPGGATAASSTGATAWPGACRRTVTSSAPASWKACGGAWNAAHAAGTAALLPMLALGIPYSPPPPCCWAG